MTHARSQIRQSFVEALIGLPTTGGNVYSGRVFPVYDGILPGLVVSTRSENIDPDVGGKEHFQSRSLEVSVAIHAKAETGLDDILDAISAEIETVVFNSVQLQQICRCLDLTSTETEVNGEGENAIGVCLLLFTVEYLTNEGQPVIII